MATDPFLAAHLVSDCCFEVGGEYSPASVRDQMIRAYLVVDRAYQQGIIDAGRSLLVVGAGPSGLTAAIRAAELGVKVVVIEKRAGQAFLLGACSSRDVEPTLYDWPVDHWARDLFGRPGARMELWWRANRADVIALDWQRRLTGILTRHPLIDIRFDTVLRLPTGGSPPAVGPAGLLQADLVKASSGATTPASFGGCVSCVGFGRERTQVGAYDGFQFWDTDDFQKPDCGLNFQPRVIISGGGDGALQDFTRVMTLRSSKAAFAEILRALGSSPWLISNLHSDIQSAEDVAARALSWNGRPEHDAPIIRRLEIAHQKVIDRLQRSSAWPAVEWAVLAMLRRRPQNVHLVHRGPFFSSCYPLNRFLTLIILRVLNGVPVRIPQTEMVDVRGFGHACTSAAGCHGQSHEVELRRNGAVWTNTYDVVIIRHGIVRPRRLFSGPAPNRPRHLLPYFVDI